MKNLLIVILLGIFLTGCSKKITLDVSKATQKEIGVLSVINKNKHNSCTAKPTMVIQAINKRVTAPTEDESFSDVEFLVKSFDESMSCGIGTPNVTGIQELYQKLYNETLFEKGNTLLEIQTTADSQYLTPQEIRQLTSTVKDCNIAKVRVISLLDSNNLLTKEDKDIIEKLVLRCESDKLIQELNN